MRSPEEIAFMKAKQTGRSIRGSALAKVGIWDEQSRRNQPPPRWGLATRISDMAHLFGRCVAGDRAMYVSRCGRIRLAGYTPISIDVYRRVSCKASEGPRGPIPTSAFWLEVSADGQFWNRCCGLCIRRAFGPGVMLTKASAEAVLKAR